MHHRARFLLVHANMSSNARCRLAVCAHMVHRYSRKYEIPLSARRGKSRGDRATPTKCFDLANTHTQNTAIRGKEATKISTFIIQRECGVLPVKTGAATNRIASSAFSLLYICCLSGNE